MKMTRILLILAGLAAALMLLTACRRSQGPVGGGRLQVVTSLFPLYDFVRRIGGDSVTVTLLLPPGVEPHHFEPKPDDALALAKADLFIYTSKDMEPWAEKMAEGLQRAGRPVRLEAGRGARQIAAVTGDGHRHGRGGRGAYDPHVWLDIDNAVLMTDRIAGELSALLPAKKEYFAANAAAYRLKLQELDNRFRNGLKECATREFIHGGHYAFAYLADRYSLNYVSAYGISADSEPSPRRVAELVDAIRSRKLHYVFYEELLAPRISETVAAETGAAMLQLHGLHNLSKSEFDAGASYLGLMEQNLAALRKGLECRGQ